MHAEIPLAVVGMSFREGPTSARAALVAADQGPDAPSVQLLSTGTATGIVRVETCSRATWVISSPKPAWAASLLTAGLLAGAGDAALERRPRVRVGRAALDHLFRVALGLEAVVEGEPAVGRQVLRAFDQAHEVGTTDGVCHQVQKEIGGLLRRRRTSADKRRGVQTLVLERLRAELGDDAALAERRAPILGTGEIARAMLRNVPGSRTFPRAEMDAFQAEAGRAPAVVICTGGPHPWLRLPARADAPLALDVGSPPQVLEAPGWRVVGLDQLLTGQLALPEVEHERLLRLVEEACDRVGHALIAPPPTEALAALDAERRAFEAEELPGLTAGLGPEAEAALVRGIKRFGHRLIRGAASGPTGGNT